MVSQFTKSSKNLLYLGIILSLLLVILFNGCDVNINNGGPTPTPGSASTPNPTPGTTPGTTPGSASPPGPPSGSTPTPVPVKTIQWENDGTVFTQFSTNDSQYNGREFYHPFNSQSTLKWVEINLKKMSGNSNQGYGMVFYYQDSDNWYKIAITTTGKYRIEKRFNGTTTYNYNDGNGFVSSNTGSWPSTPSLHTGYDLVNDIHIEHPSTNKFDIYFNGDQTATFTDSAITSGNCGFFVSIGSSTNESFPNTPEDVRFKLVNADYGP